LRAEDEAFCATGANAEAEAIRVAAMAIFIFAEFIFRRCKKGYNANYEIVFQTDWIFI